MNPRYTYYHPYYREGDEVSLLGQGDKKSKMILENLDMEGPPMTKDLRA